MQLSILIGVWVLFGICGWVRTILFCEEIILSDIFIAPLMAALGPIAYLLASATFGGDITLFSWHKTGKLRDIIPCLKAEGIFPERISFITPEWFQSRVEEQKKRNAMADALFTKLQDLNEAFHD